MNKPILDPTLVQREDELVKIIADEIEDRTIQANESGEPEQYTEELKALAELQQKVANKESLNWNEYGWLAYLAANDREMLIREELES